MASERNEIVMKMKEKRIRTESLDYALKRLQFIKISLWKFYI